MTPLSLLLKASILMLAAALIHTLIGRRISAAARHLLWTLVVTGLLLLPVLSATLPAWSAYTTTVSDKRPAAKVETPQLPMPLDGSIELPATTVSRTVPWPTLYTMGVIFLLARLVVERLRIGMFVRRATEVSDTQWTDLARECAGRMGVTQTVRLLRSREETIPMALGIRRGTILIPAIADTWTMDRRRAVLLHEMAHLARRDCLIQVLAAATCALYWVHPGVWWIARRLRVERELACDDRVLSAGAGAREYAGHLLELAYALRSGRPPVLAVSMAGSGQLEGRMLAVLDAARNRAIPALRAHLAAVIILIALLVPVAAATISVRQRAAERTATPSSQIVTRAMIEPLPDPSVPGTWDIRPTGQPRIVQVRLREGRSSYSTTIDMDHTEGFPLAQYENADGPVQFSATRDAGSFSFEGVVRSGVGAGTYSFTPSTTFPDELVKRGFDRASPAEQRVLARSDIGFAYLDELTAQGYSQPRRVAELVNAGLHGVGLQFLRGMGALGYRLGRLEELIELHNHGVSPEFIRELAAEGLPNLSTDDLLAARAHGVDPGFIHDLSALGYPKLRLDALIELRQHGVDPLYVSDLASLGYEKLSLETLIELRSHGVDPEFARQLGMVGYPKLSLDTLIELRKHGVDPGFVKDLQDVGYSGLKIEELYTLRRHGIAPDNIRRANERAGRRLSIEELRVLASRGWR